MIFQDAMNALLQGQYVTRSIWESEGGYLSRLPGLTHPFKTVIQPKPECRPWAPDLYDCTATDWLIVTPHDPLTNDTNMTELNYSAEL